MAWGFSFGNFDLQGARFTGCTNRAGGSPILGSTLFLHRLTGAHELRRRFALTGGSFFLHRKAGVLELRKHVRPDGAERFSLNLSEGAALCGARETAASAAGTKRKGHLRFPFLFGLLPFPCFLIWRRLPTCDRFETGVRQRIFSSVYFSTCSQCQIPFCYTGRLFPAGAA